MLTEPRTKPMTERERYLTSLRNLRTAAAEFASRFAECAQASRLIPEEDADLKSAAVQGYAYIVAIMRQLRDHIPGAREIFAELAGGK